MTRFFLIAAATLASGAACADDATAPAKAQTCIACHGEGGAKPILPDYPVLAGQYADYLEVSLREYQSGKRKNPVMTAQAASLSADEIEELARYFSELPSPLYTPSIVADHAAK